MKTALFARPNLKLMVVFAVGLLAIQHFISAREPAGFLVAESSAGDSISWDDIDRLVARSLEQPTVENYLALSESYRQRGDVGHAMMYIKKARLAAEIEAD